MGEVIGYLRPDKATYGERLVLRKLEHSLPPDFTVYVECPLHDKRLERFPDFIVLCTFGVVVLEVKDWVQVERVDKCNAHIRTRQGRVRRPFRLRYKGRHQDSCDTFARRPSAPKCAVLACGPSWMRSMPTSTA